MEKFTRFFRGMTGARRCALQVAAAWAALVPSLGAQAETIRLIDQEGRAVLLAKPAARVVPLPTPSASMLASVAGNAAPIAAMSEDAQRAAREGPLGAWMPALLAIPTKAAGRAGQANIEELLRLAPDLVLQWSNRGGDALAQFERAGLNVAAIRYGREEDVVAWLTLMGAALGKQERAASLVAWRERWLELLEERFASLTEEQRLRVLYILRGRAGLQVAGAGTYNDFTIRLSGGRNVAASLADFRTVTPEQILAWDPDVIVLGSFEESLTPEWLARQPGLSGLRALKTKRVHKAPIGGYRWDPPSQESPLFWLWLARLLHAERMPESLDAAMHEGLALLYNAQVTAETEARILGQSNAAATAERPR